MRQISIVLCIVAMGVFGSGCAKGPWVTYYKQTNVVGGKLTPTDAVQVRTVEPERYKAYEDDFGARRLRNNIAIEDWKTVDFLNEMDVLLSCLRIPERIPKAYVIGVSDFGYQGAFKVDDQAVRRAGMEKGADYVVVCQVFAGMVKGVRYVPQITTSTFGGNVTTYVKGQSSTGNYQGSGFSTTDVPVPTDIQDWRIRAFFIRKTRPGDPLPQRTAGGWQMGSQ
jgi:hypothetical protein